jgi:hypothetical protein
MADMCDLPGRANQYRRHCEEQSDEAIHSSPSPLWIASRSLSSGAHSRDPLARNDGFLAVAVCFCHFWDDALAPDLIRRVVCY